MLAACGAAAVTAADEFYDPNNTNNYAEASVIADPVVTTNITGNVVNGNNVSGNYSVGDSVSNAIIINSGQSQNFNTNYNRLSNSNSNIEISISSAGRTHKR